jgi:hypothetical protein
VAKGNSRREIENLLADDPFHIHGVAVYNDVQFTPTMTAPELSALITA